MSIKGHLITYIGLALFDDDDNNNNTYSFSNHTSIMFQGTKAFTNFINT